MPKFTEHLVLPPGAEHRRAVPIKNDVEDLGPVVELTREQQRRAAAVVLQHLGDGGAAFDVLRALFQPARPLLPAGQTRTPENFERLDQLGRIRQWASDEGLPLDGRGGVPRAMRAAYDRAHLEGAS